MSTLAPSKKPGRSSSKKPESVPLKKSESTPSEESDGVRLVQYRCQSCNAPYPLGADDVIATCPYCGFTFTVDGGTTSKHLMLPNRLDAQNVRDVVLGWIRSSAAKSIGPSVAKSADIDSPMLQWLPMFRVDSSYKTHYLGANKDRREGHHGWVRIESGETGEGSIWILARRHAVDFAMEEFIDSIDDTKPVTFDIKATQSSPVLNSEITEADAQPRAHQRKSEKDRAALLKEVERLFDYQLDVHTKDCTYVHVPYWLVPFTFRNGTFRVAVSGVTGEVLLGEVPVTKRYRIGKWLTSVTMLISSALLLQALPYVTYAVLQGSSSSDDSGAILFIPLAVLLGGFVLWTGSVRMLGTILRYQICLTAEGEDREKGPGIIHSLGHLVGRFE